MATIEVKHARDIMIGELMERSQVTMAKLADYTYKGIEDKRTEKLRAELGEYVFTLVTLRRLK